LTFDDGPNKVVTPKVLDILKEEDVKATFFVIGKNVLQYPEIVRRAYEEGHFIANHGYDHNNTNLYKSRENFINEIRKTDNEIGKAIGVEDYCSHVFRFPNGFMAPNDKSKKNEAAKLLSEMNYTYIDWNCLNNDSMKKYNKSQLMKNLKKSSKDKNTLVVLMHDTKDVSDSSTVLKESIEYFRQQGYEFKNFYDLLGKE
jgi:peptidoglycan/xylan/chitin deacetylase (PgdA/CDA1 family)